MGTARRAEVDREQETNAWILAHQALSRLAKQRAAGDAEEGRWLLAALRSAAHLHLGFGSFSEYVERSFGYRPRSTQEKLRVAEALEELPELTRALEQGTLHWSAVRELTRVAIPENEREWLALAHGKSVRQLEELVAGKVSGDDPASPPRASERRHVLRFEVASETFALFREAVTALRRSMDCALDDDAALLALARLALGGPRDEGRASYQIAVTVCAVCGRGQQPASGELVPIGPEILAMAHCDGQHLGCIMPHVANDSALRAGEDFTPHVANDSAPLGDPEPSMDGHVSADPHAHDDSAPSDEIHRSHPGAGSRACTRSRGRASDAHVDASIQKPARAKQSTPPALPYRAALPSAGLPRLIGIVYRIHSENELVGGCPMTDIQFSSAR